MTCSSLKNLTPLHPPQKSAFDSLFDSLGLNSRLYEFLYTASAPPQKADTKKAAWTNQLFSVTTHSFSSLKSQLLHHTYNYSSLSFSVTQPIHLLTMCIQGQTVPDCPLSPGVRVDRSPCKPLCEASTAQHSVSPSLLYPQGFDCPWKSTYCIDLAQPCLGSIRHWR